MRSRFPWRDTSEDIAKQGHPQWETPGGAQQKADKAEKNAKEYSDSKLSAHIGTGGSAHALAVPNVNAGFISGSDQAKLNSIKPGAEVNQNAYSKINGIPASEKEDALNIEGGVGITITPDPVNKKVRVTATGTTTPGPHGSEHTGDGSDPIPDATVSVSGLMSAADKISLDATVEGLATLEVHTPRVYNVIEYGADPTGVNNSTTAIQTAIDDAFNNGRGIVSLPPGTYKLDASTLGMTLWNYGVSIDTNTGCLVLRNGVSLVGSGIGVTVLKPSSPHYVCVYLADGKNSTIANLEIDGGWVDVGGGHGIFQCLTENNKDIFVSGTRLKNLYIHHVGSYGIGIQNGVHSDVVIEKIHTFRTGADGIDIKNRSTSGVDSKGITVKGIFIDTFGLRLDSQTGLDMRGIVKANSIQVVNVGRTGANQTGIRFRAQNLADGPNAWARRSSLSEIYVSSNVPDNTGVLGVDCGSPDISITGGVIEGCYTGVNIGGNTEGNADNVSVSQLVVINSKNYAYRNSTGSNNVRYIGCIAKSSNVGFRNEGNNTLFIGCSAVDVTSTISTAVAAAPSQLTAGCDFGRDFISLNFLTAGRVSIEAKGVSNDIDLSLLPKGTGSIRMGSFTSGSDAPVVGYITIKDSNGVSRKLAVIN
ncbi:hypothetical protein AWU65_20415 [Paenibacillus glucanolyticus]|uniref:Rhamnogalacturonase A/B/Epimerase-like pectate lyase domain-containing protein n=1 Tax=Paenibacillus glucanolyticus TaxID=59843 RepID=A0A163LGW0_9BACL|nr:glycosyl hydrolase family 28-related protein [Paenibacillus glucanolyticus]KZS48122.1 hypothetical protein AWU65_20415 [Paenibacillus glucanolyticus]